MQKTKKILLYSITIVVIVFTFFWNHKMNQWLSEQPNGGEDVVRVDLFVLVPLLITLVVISLFQLFRKPRD